MCIRCEVPHTRVSVLSAKNACRWHVVRPQLRPIVHFMTLTLSCAVRSSSSGTAPASAPSPAARTAAQAPHPTPLPSAPQAAPVANAEANHQPRRRESEALACCAVTSAEPGPVVALAAASVPAASLVAV